MELSHVSLRNGLGIARDTPNYNAVYLPRDISTTTLPRKTGRTSRVNHLVHIVLLLSFLFSSIHLPQRQQDTFSSHNCFWNPNLSSVLRTGSYSIPKFLPSTLLLLLFPSINPPIISGMYPTTLHPSPIKDGRRVLGEKTANACLSSTHHRPDVSPSKRPLLEAPSPQKLLSSPLFAGQKRTIDQVNDDQANNGNVQAQHGESRAETQTVHDVHDEARTHSTAHKDNRVC